MTQHSSPSAPSEAQLRKLVMTQLSATARIGHVALLLSALTMVVATASLALTEAELPPRAQAAFGTVILVGVAWVAYAWWVLSTRRPLLATHRVVAARMALTFSAIFAAVSVVVAFLTPAGAAWLAAPVGGVMCLVAWRLLSHAHATVQRLRERQHEIERALQAHHGGRT